jgi:hypothetical protein
VVNAVAKKRAEASRPSIYPQAFRSVCPDDVRRDLGRGDEDRLRSAFVRKLRLLGVRRETWFDGATSQERAEDANRHLARIPRDARLRVRCTEKAEGSEADGAVRAFV